MDGSFARLSVVFLVSRQFCARVFLLLPKLSWYLSHFNSRLLVSNLWCLTSILRSKFLKKFHEFVLKEGVTEFWKIPIDFRHPEIFGVNSTFETFLCIIMNLSYYFISINYGPFDRVRPHSWWIQSFFLILEINDKILNSNLCALSDSYDHIRCVTLWPILTMFMFVSLQVRCAESDGRTWRETNINIVKMGHISDWF